MEPVRFLLYGCMVVKLWGGAQQLHSYPRKTDQSFSFHNMNQNQVFAGQF